MPDFQVATRSCGCDRSFHDTKLIAVTGGPGGGKTAMLEMALRSFCSHVGVLPEAASVVFGGGFPRHETEAGRRAAQRAIFHVQRELEALVIAEGAVAIALCDRGTIDGVAYWPGPIESYWESLGTTLDAELERYAAVIHMQTPAADQGYNRAYALRVESAQEALELDRRILRAWERHPRRLVVGSDDDFLRKAGRALELVRAELPSCCHLHPIVTGAEEPHGEG